MKLQLLCEMKARFQARLPFCTHPADTVGISTEASMTVMKEQTTDQWAAVYSNLVQS